MEFEDLLKKEEQKLDKFVSKACLIVYLFLLFVNFLNWIDVFIVEDIAMMVVLGISTVLFLSASFLARTNINHELKCYLIVTLLVMEVGVLYAVLTIHVVLMFLFPAAIINIYGKRNLTKYAMFATIVSMCVSHVLSYYFSAVPEEPFTKMADILLFALLPKLITYIALAYVFYYETNHNEAKLKEIYQYAIDMHTTQSELVREFAEISESKSGQTGQHVKRVSEYVSAMADALNIRGKEKESLVTASMMHDVGKLMIPTEILDKPGKLTDEEFTKMKEHTQYGYDLLKNSPGRTMELAKNIALEHHERWDGRGYAGKTGDSIDYYSRIVAIADVFDALVSKRSYKDSWNPEQAYEEIVVQSGRQFDPELVEVFKICYPKFLEILDKYKDE